MTLDLGEWGVVSGENTSSDTLITHHKMNNELWVMSLTLVHRKSLLLTIDSWLFLPQTFLLPRFSCSNNCNNPRLISSCPFVSFEPSWPRHPYHSTYHNTCRNTHHNSYYNTYHTTFYNTHSNTYYNTQYAKRHTKTFIKIKPPTPFPP